MPLTFHPKPGTVLLCDYQTGFKPPEMIKKRPAIVISPRLRHRDSLCTVVPLSLTEPHAVQEYHYKLVPERPLPKPWDAGEYWVKADMISTVGFFRLDLIRIGRDADGRRRYLNTQISPSDLENIKRAVMRALGL